MVQFRRREKKPGEKPQAERFDKRIPEEDPAGKPPVDKFDKRIPEKSVLAQLLSRKYPPENPIRKRFSEKEIKRKPSLLDVLTRHLTNGDLTHHTTTQPGVHFVLPSNGTKRMVVLANLDSAKGGYSLETRQVDDAHHLVVTHPREADINMLRAIVKFTRTKKPISYLDAALARLKRR